MEGYLDPLTNKPHVVLTKKSEMLHTQLSPNGQNLVVMDTSYFSQPYIYTRVDDRQRLMVVEKVSNNFKVIDLKTKEVIKTYPGNEEEPYSKQKALKPIRIRRVQIYEIRQRGQKPLMEKRPRLSSPPQPARPRSQGGVPELLEPRLHANVLEHQRNQ